MARWAVMLIRKKGENLGVLVLLCLFGMTRLLAAADVSSPFLKGLLSIKYQISVERPNTGPCTINLDRLTTAIDSVANQSTKLKLVRQRDHFEEDRQLSDEVTKANEKFGRYLREGPEQAAQAAKKELDEVNERANKHLFAPFLLFSIQTMDVNIGCSATAGAQLSAGLASSKIIASDVPVSYPYMILWESHWLLKAPYNEILSQVVQTSEQTMKTFVNDWARAQE